MMNSRPTLQGDRKKEGLKKEMVEGNSGSREPKISTQGIRTAFS